MHCQLVTYKEWYANFVWRCLGKFHTRWQKTLPHPRYLDLALEPGLESFPWSRFFHQLQTNLEPSTWIYYVQNHKLVNNTCLYISYFVIINNDIWWRFITSPVLSIMLMSSKNVSSLIWRSVKRNATCLYSDPAIFKTFFKSLLQLVTPYVLLTFNLKFLHYITERWLKQRFNWEMHINQYFNYLYTKYLVVGNESC